ncbi:hypothetical protein ACFE04_010211 [Oxalis oulophora]
MTLHRLRKKSTTPTTSTSSPPPTLTKLIRLVCSFNGTFQVKPQSSNKLRYTNGETRIISVDRNIPFFKLQYKISNLCLKFHSFMIHYQLHSKTDESETEWSTMLTLESDVDVRIMFEEYDKLGKIGKNVRLWLFVGFDTFRDDDDCKGSEDLVFGEKHGDNSFKKVVLKKQLLANGLVDCSSYDVCVNEREVVTDTWCDHPLIDLGPEHITSQNDPFLANSNALGYRSQREQYVGSENYGTLEHLVGPKVYPLNPKDGNLRVDTNGSTCSFMGNHKYGMNDGRNYRIHPYYIKNDPIPNPDNLVKAGKQRAAKVDGRVLAGKCYPGVERKNCKIVKQEPKWKPSSRAKDSPYTSHFEMPDARYQTQLQIFHELPTQCELIHNRHETGIFEAEKAKISDISHHTGCGTGTVLVSKDNFQNLIEPSVELLDNLLLSSSNELEPLIKPSVASTKAADVIVKPHQGEIQEDLRLDEKADVEEDYKDSPIIGAISNSLTATIKSSDLEYVKELGSGTYGTVFHGKWKGSDVAIKRLKPSCFAEGSKEQDRLVADFWKEAHMLGQLHHPNIVAFYGVVSDGPVTNLATVTEYLVNGSLKQVLKRKDRTIDRRKRLILAMGAAFGMEYLHEKNIVHFDLKSHNFLVNMRDPQRPICKIGDLGLSKIKQRTLVSGGVRGTIPWMAPELLNSKNLVTEKVDVYSFGIVMWELLTGEEPYANMRSEEIIAGIIMGSLRPEIPTWCDPAWGSLMERCWSSDPNSRPSFTEIAKELRLMSAAMNIKLGELRMVLQPSPLMSNAVVNPNSKGSQVRGLGSFVLQITCWINSVQTKPLDYVLGLFKTLNCCRKISN